MKTIPYHRKPADLSVDEWQTELRKQFAATQQFKVTNREGTSVFSDYNVFNPLTNKTYKVAIRSITPDYNFCSCPDFATNNLGTCKHIEFILARFQNNPRLRRILEKGYTPEYTSMTLRYGAERKVTLRIGQTQAAAISELAKAYFDKEGILELTMLDHIDQFIEKVLTLDPTFRCYSDAMEYILECRGAQKRQHLIAEKYSDAGSAPLTGLIKTTLFPYQAKGVLFAANAGRCLIADEMGLGKTIQAIGASELMAKEFGVDRVLIVCPTSLKFQWKTEIEKFTDRSVQVIEGNYVTRRQQYRHPKFFQIVSYGYILNDLDNITDLKPDLIILDEAQRIKNWRTKTAQTVKQMESDYAIVLTGTPLENRLEELHSLVQFIDKFKLGPLFKFLHHHQNIDKDGKINGYKHLDQIGHTLKDIMIRRNKKDVLAQLPQRTTQYIFTELTQDQRNMHDDQSTTVSQLMSKWARHGFLLEPDRQRLFRALSCMRMACDSLYILDETIDKSPKLDELMIMLAEILESPNNKVVIFSQWERMLRLLSFRLEDKAIGYRFLHGSVPGKKRGKLVEDFQSIDDVRLFLSTDAGGVGLNLQSASIVINLDLPWNPAILEQRIARVHRMGQKNKVQVLNFVAANTIEQGMIKTLQFKQSIADGIFGNGDADIFMDDSRFKTLMETIATATENIKPQEAQPTDSVANETKMLSEDMSASDQPPLVNAQKEQSVLEDPLKSLFKTGIQLLEHFQSHIKEPNSEPSSFIEKDAATGQSYLKIPMPDEKVVAQALGAFESLLSLLKK